MFLFVSKMYHFLFTQSLDMNHKGARFSPFEGTSQNTFILMACSWRKKEGTPEKQVKYFTPIVDSENTAWDHLLRWSQITQMEREN